MTVVVDLGCHTHAGHPQDESVLELVGRYQPDTLYGFDPHPLVQEGRTDVNGTRVVIERSAAWTYNGYVAYDQRDDRPLAASVGAGPEVVACFDLAERLEVGDIVKMDVEGAEYPLLEHLIATGTDEKIAVLLVEWHDLPARERERFRIMERIRCDVEAW